MSFTAKNRRECQEWIRHIRDQIDDGLTYACTKLKLGDYLFDWLDTEKSVFRPSTWSHYTQLLHMYIIPNIGNITLKDLRTEHIQRLYNLLVRQQVGVPTIQKIHKLLRSSLGSATETGMIARNPIPFAHPPKEFTPEMMILTETQVSDFLIAIQGHKWEALFHLAITSGMRRSKLLALKWEDLDWVRLTIKVERQLSRYPNTGGMFQPLKTKASRRSIALGDETIQTLRDHYDRQWLQRLRAGANWVDNDLIFTNSKGEPICAGYMTQVFKKLLEAAGVPKVRFHDLRHTSASLMINKGIPPTTVARRLGHSKTSTTLDVYSHLMEGQQREAATLMDELITPTKLYTNCTRSRPVNQIATQIDETMPDLAENINNHP